MYHLYNIKNNDTFDTYHRRLNNDTFDTQK